jgi:hypothetical protein
MSSKNASYKLKFSLPKTPIDYFIMTKTTINKLKIAMKIKLTYFLLFFCVLAFGQIEGFNYQRSIEKPTNDWHKILLPNEMFGKISPNFSDIRIIGITANKDTVEAPYLVQFKEESTDNQDINFKTLNVSHNEKGYYYTFEIPTNEAINQLNFEFNTTNFDWQIDLEGSQNQQEWFMLSQNYRMVSIQNEWTNYQFTKVVFPNAKYRYLRVLIKSKTDPKLAATKITRKNITEGNYQNYLIEKLVIKENKKEKQTEVFVDLASPVPVSFLDFQIRTKVDYYRNVTIQYVADSFKTDKGWQYSYNTLTSGTLSSIEKNEFRFTNIVLQQLKITIENNDNALLSLENITVKGAVYQLISRFSEVADYRLFYGKPNSQTPNYDINRFTNSIPTNLKNLTLGDEMAFDKVIEKTTQPLFENKLWLWAIMILIIGILGWFSLKMMK